MKRYVIGDIHGGFLALKHVLELAQFDYENDQLIAVGDVCDGWPDVAESIEELLKIKNLVYCRGNHDDWTLQFIKNESAFARFSSQYQGWIQHGGTATQLSYNKHLELLDKHIEFLQKSLRYYIDEDNRLFLHAGFDTRYEIEDQPFDHDYPASDGKSSHYFWDRIFWSNVSRGFTNGCEKYHEIYIGHTPTISDWKHGRPVNFGNVWNMDTGACYMGKLSLMNLDTKELFQSEPVFTYYPEDKGRNGKLLAADPEWNKWGLFQD